MKKTLPIWIMLSVFILSCDKETEPEPEVIRAYCYLYHFIPQMSSVSWEVDGVELPDDQEYAYVLPGAVILETSTEEIEFVVKDPASREVLVNQFLELEENKFYNVIVCGSAEDPLLLFSEIETSQPAPGSVKVQALHSIPGQGPVDVYMGDTSPEKRVVTALEFLELTDPFEVPDFDIRAKMTLTAHSANFHPDSVLLTSDYNDIASEANYLTILAHFTQDTTSELTFWLYVLPRQ